MIWIAFATCAVFSVLFGRLTRLYVYDTRQSSTLLVVGMTLFVSGVSLGVLA